MVLLHRHGGEGEVDRSSDVALRVKCKCGKVLKIPSRLAGKAAACPHCKKKYRIPSEPDPQPSHLDLDLLANLPADPPANPHGIELETNAGGELEPPSAVAVDTDAPIKLGYAREHGTPEASGSRLRDAILDPRRTFWADAIGSFIYPIRNGENIVTLIFILFISAVQEFIPSFGCLGLVCSGIIFGWLAALYFSVIQITATGSDDLPGIRMEDGFYEDIIKPAFLYIGAIAVVLSPSVLLTIAIALGWVPQSMGAMLPFWIAAGIFLLPITLLLFAFDAPGMIFRLDLIVSTIWRTILPYLAIWLLLSAVGIGLLVTAASSSIVDSFMPQFLLNTSIKQAAIGLSLKVALNMIGTYLTIVAMRAIGLYYLHFKKRFTIVME